MPRPTIQQVSGMGDVVTTYQWNMFFTSFPAALYGGIIPASEDLNLRMTSTTVPIKGNTDQEINVRGHKISQAGPADYGDRTITLGFYETADMIVSNFFLAWSETCVQTGTGIHGSNDKAKCNMQLQQLNRQDDPVWLYSLHGCRLLSYTKSDLSGEDGTSQPTLSIKWDWFDQQAL